MIWDEFKTGIFLLALIFFAGIFVFGMGIVECQDHPEYYGCANKQLTR